MYCRFSETADLANWSNGGDTPNVFSGLVVFGDSMQSWDTWSQNVFKIQKVTNKKKEDYKTKKYGWLYGF